MRFLIIELDINAYQNRVGHLLSQRDCHIFIDTNIFAQLFKLNGTARSDFFEWVRVCSTRFHIANWVVMEYQKHCTGQKLNEYLEEIQTAESTKKNLEMLQKFFCGYVDNNELQNTVYNGCVNELLTDMEEVINKYAKILSAVKIKKSERINQVRKDIEDNLKDLVLDTNIYKIIDDLYFDYQLRLESDVPPGFKDFKNKEANQIGDLIVWKEILQYCKEKNIAKAVFITRDGKTDTTYSPPRQILDGHSIDSKDHIRIVHESMIYEFKKATNGSEDFYLINFEMLVKILSDRYRNLAYSFQMVSRENELNREEDNEDEQEQIAIQEEDVENPQQPEVEPAADNNANAPTNYSVVALEDGHYLDHCDDIELKSCVTRLKSYNWYIQNNAVNDLRNLASRNWQDNQANKDAFFVVGRNLLQSADGNSFEADRFIRKIQTILQDKQMFLKHALIDGCLYEVFFDSTGKIRPKGFKARYLDNLIEQARLLLGHDAFIFINSQLNNVHNRFVPIVGTDNEYRFNFQIKQPTHVLDDFHTVSLTINERDCSATFTKQIASEFAGHDEITNRLSIYYAIPKERIHVEGIPNGLTSLKYIKEE